MLSVQRNRKEIFSNTQANAGQEEEEEDTVCMDVQQVCLSIHPAFYQIVISIISSVCLHPYRRRVVLCIKLLSLYLT